MSTDSNPHPAPTYPYLSAKMLNLNAAGPSNAPIRAGDGFYFGEGFYPALATPEDAFGIEVDSDSDSEACPVIVDGVLFMSRTAAERLRNTLCGILGPATQSQPTTL